MTSDRRWWLGWQPLALPRLLVGLASLLASLLAIVPAPTTALWMLTIAVTEWGHLLALLALSPLLPGWRRSWSGRIGGACGLAAALLALTPLLRAVPVARSLPAQLTAAFGTARPRAVPNAPARPAPLVLSEILTGIALPQQPPQTLAYATSQGQELLLDLYRPPVAGTPAPGLLVIHGGSWSGGDRTQLAELNYYLAARGYLVAAMSYRLAPAHPFPAAYDDVRAALAYLRGHSAELGLDSSRMVLLGRSAGGQLALLAAYTAPEPVRGVVSLYGPADLRYGYANPANPRVIDSRAVLRDYLGGSPDTTGQTYDAASPIGMVGPTTPPTLLIHGSRDELVSPAQSERLAARLAAAGRPGLLLRLPWATHGCDYRFAGPSGQLSTYAIERFLAAVTR